jgi:hypothetical protein
VSAIGAPFFGVSMNLFMSYDNYGFKAALDYGTDEHFNREHTLAEQLEQLLDHASWDLYKGFCKSFQVYTEDGELIFNSELLNVA